MALKFTDLSTWDLNIIKSLAVQILIDTRETNRYVALIDSVLSCIYSKGYNLSDTTNLNRRLLNELESKSNSNAEEIIRLIFECLNSMNIVIIQDVNRDPTWSKPPRNLEYKPYYKPWMITWKN